MSALCSRPRSTGPVDEAPTVRFLTVGGRPTAVWAAYLAPSTGFWSLFIWGSHGLFSIRFEESFWSSFVYLFQWLYPQVLELYFEIKREFIKRVFQVIYLSFSPHIPSLFFSQTLELSIAISTYRRVVVRLFLGDQGVVITKDFIFVLRRRTCVFAVFRVLVRALCRGAASAS